MDPQPTRPDLRASAPIHLSDAFAPDYATARSRFRAAAAELGWLQESCPIGLYGPDGGDLTIDVALTPDDDAQSCLVVSTGLHGVEGFFGTAVQLSLMRRWRAAAPRGVRLVFLHALNPFGFAWV